MAVTDPSTLGSAEADEASKPAAGEPKVIGRRRFLGQMAAGSGLAVAFALVDPLAEPAEAADQLPEFVDFTDLFRLVFSPFAYDFLIEITPENRVRLEVPRAEVGQGITTTAAMIVAEELDVSLESIDVGLSPGEARRFLSQMTGGSSSVVTLWEPLRKVTAMLRGEIVATAAEIWSIPADQLQTRDGLVQAPNGWAVPYSWLSQGVKEPSPSAPWATPKDPSEFRVIGQPQPRVDAHDIVTGKARYAMDLDVAPGAQSAVVAQPPTPEAPLVAFDPSEAWTVPGVLEILPIKIGLDREADGIAVVAETFGAAQKAMNALKITWGAGPADDLSDAQIVEDLRAINTPNRPGRPWWGKAVEGEFIFPYLSHAPMETNSAIADVSGGRIRIWTGSKTPLSIQNRLALEHQLPVEQIDVNVVPCGGSFGRRLFFEASMEAARISKAVGHPIKLAYTRAQDTKAGRARPFALHHVQAVYFNGWFGPPRLANFHHHASAAALDAQHGLGDALTSALGTGAPPLFSQVFWIASQAIHYKVFSSTLNLNEKRYPITTSSWRGVYSPTANVANEIIVDEVAREAGEDELTFRLNCLEDERAKEVLRAVADAGQWGRPMEPRRAQGLGVHLEYKSAAAVLVEVEYDPDPNVELRVTKLVIAAQVNQVVNPLGLKAQLVGSAVDAISVIIKTGLHIDNGAIRESSYGDYRIARMDDVPPDIEVILLPGNGEHPGGAGELVMSPAAAAIANAFARATGVKPRRFPLHENYPEA